MRKGLDTKLAAVVLALVVLSCTKEITIEFVVPEKEDEEQTVTEPEKPDDEDGQEENEGGESSGDRW